MLLTWLFPTDFTAFMTYVTYGVYIFILVCIKDYFIISENEIGVVRKNFTLNPFKSKLSNGKQVAVNGEPGYQAEILSPGWQFKMPGMYRIFKFPIITIKAGKIGIVHALEGKNKEDGRNFPPSVECNKFEDAKAFLNNGGYKGTQLDVLTEGKWYINPKLFTVSFEKSTEISKGFVGIVETKEGKNLEGAIAGSIIPNHNKFKNANAFVKNGGYMGLQEEILDEGIYEINTLFASIKIVPVCEIDAGTVGVVFSKHGLDPQNEGADDLVDEGYKGIQKKVLREGKYKKNTDIYEIIIVPVHQITLEWNDDEKKDKGRYDAGLESIKFKSDDNYHFKLPLTQTIRIKPESAPILIKKMGISSNEIKENINTPTLFDEISPVSKERYGAVKAFVYRFLEPEVKAVFSDILPKYKALDFFKQQMTIQTSAADSIKDKLSYFGVDAVSTIMDFTDYPEELKDRINANHELLTLIDKEETDKKQMERDIFLAQKEAEKKAIKDESDNRAREGEIAAFGGWENYEKYKKMEFDKDKAYPTVYAPGMGGYNSNNDVLGLNNRIIESLNIGTSTTTHQNLLLPPEHSKGKVVENKERDEKNKSDDIIDADD